MLGRFREKYQRLFLPLGKIFAMLSLSPNMLTLLSLLSSIASMLEFKDRNLLAGVFFILLTGMFNMADGTTARYLKNQTRFGGVLDHVTDRYAEFFIITGIVYGGYVSWFWGFFALFGMVMASYTRAKAESIGRLKSCTVGIAERQEKLILIIIGALAQPYYENALLYVIITVALISHVTVIQRLLFVKKMT